MARLVFSDKTYVRKYRKRSVMGWKRAVLQFEPGSREWWEDTDIVVAFNLPRISACLERLMGTNVVRLTDRKYMKELRQRIRDDYSNALMSRIKARELKEIERERLLIIDGKTDAIPDELANDPIFMVNKIANKEILKKRSKLKTNRERNAERLKQQGVKWERERWQHEEEERERLEQAKLRHQAQKELEEKYREEDAERGMDLLRIDNEDWRECEMKLKEFLENERAAMLARSLKVPTPFSSDPLDIKNIVRARQKFRETEKRIRQELEEKSKQAKQPAARTVLEQPQEESLLKMGALVKHDPNAELFSQVSYSAIGELLQGKHSDETESDVSEEELQEVMSSISEAKRRYADELLTEMDAEVQRGLLISKEQCDHLKYEEQKIVQLRNAKDIRELYLLAEEIIIGEPREGADALLFDEEGEEDGVVAQEAEENDEGVE